MTQLLTLSERSSQKLSNNALQAVLRVKSAAPAIGPLRLFDPQHAGVLNNLPRKEIEPKDILLTTGYGVPKEAADVPVRAVALLLPALQMMQSFVDAGSESPTYLVYQATDFIVKTNNLDEESSQVFSQTLKQYLAAFVGEMFPDLVPYVQFEFGCEMDEQVTKDISEIAEKIRHDAMISIDAMDIIDQLKRYDRKHSKGSDTYAEYAAANVIYNGAIPAKYPFRDAIGIDPKIVIPIGGKAEKPFFSYSISEAQESPIVPMLTHLGERPVYYPRPELGDPMSVSDYSAFFEGVVRQKDGPIRKDLESLRYCGLTPHILMKIYPKSELDREQLTS